MSMFSALDVVWRDAHPQGTPRSYSQAIDNRMNEQVAVMFDAEADRLERLY